MKVISLYNKSSQDTTKFVSAIDLWLQIICAARNAQVISHQGNLPFQELFKSLSKLPKFRANYLTSNEIKVHPHCKDELLTNYPTIITGENSSNLLSLDFKDISLTEILSHHDEHPQSSVNKEGCIICGVSLEEDNGFKIERQDDLMHILALILSHQPERFQIVSLDILNHILESVAFLVSYENNPLFFELTPEAKQECKSSGKLSLIEDKQYNLDAMLRVINYPMQEQKTGSKTVESKTELKSLKDFLSFDPDDGWYCGICLKNGGTFPFFRINTNKSTSFFKALIHFHSNHSELFFNFFQAVVDTVQTDDSSKAEINLEPLVKFLHGSTFKCCVCSLELTLNHQDFLVEIRRHFQASHNENLHKLEGLIRIQELRPVIEKNAPVPENLKNKLSDPFFELHWREKNRCCCCYCQAYEDGDVYVALDAESRMKHLIFSDFDPEKYDWFNQFFEVVESSDQSDGHFLIDCAYCHHDDPLTVSESTMRRVMLDHFAAVHPRSLPNLQLCFAQNDHDSSSHSSWEPTTPERTRLQIPHTPVAPEASNNLDANDKYLSYGWMQPFLQFVKFSGNQTVMKCCNCTDKRLYLPSMDTSSSLPDRRVFNGIHYHYKVGIN
ncbi:hypothetical protein Ciccas_006718 [Cichlidogyrus casuarinus]|uniref:Uncharacterized protein n=1 Tax=Cichlidogyrus casuarinus TaxID=1844966 RepID=A0ABD2Q4Y1_9PLAT